MSRRLLFCLFALLAATLAAAPTRPARAQTDAPYPFQGRAHFVVELSVTDVDVDRQKVMAVDHSGTAYTVDTQDAAIILRDTSRAGETGDLVSGMRLRVTGTLLAQNILAAARVEVLPFEAGGASTLPSAPAPAPPTDDRVTTRGTVSALSDSASGFTLHVRDHSRQIVIDDQTDLTGLETSGSGGQGVRVGERVTVVGTYQPDGSILADLVTAALHPPSPLPPPRRSRRLTGPSPAPSPLSNAPVPAGVSHLTGEVSAASNRLSSRDIKVRVSPEREVTVHVPHDAVILRDGRPLSVHNLAKRDIVAVDGTPDGDAVRATRIVVLPPL